MKKSALLLAAALPVITIWSMPAMAQETAQPQASDGDIIVTARKRQESILKVPVIESVLTAETLERRQIVDIRGITQNVPGLQLGTAVLTIGTQIALRGIGTSSLDAGVEQSVAVNIDGLQFTQGTTYDSGIFDMQQVEVLKGPQALFYGKNVVGGVISIRTADPGPEAEVIGRAGYEFEAHERRAELIVSGPVSDTLGLRVAGYYTKDDGYFFNGASAAPAPFTYGAKTPRRRYNETESYFVRGTALWKPTDDFNVRFKINHGWQKLIGGGAALGSCPDGTATPAAVQVLNPGLQLIHPNEDCRIDRNSFLVDVDPAIFVGVRNNGTPFMEKKFTFGTLELNHKLSDDIGLSSETAYFKTTIDGFINGVNSSYSGPTLIADNHFNRREFTQEVRIESDFTDKPINFLLGGYFQDARIRNRIIVRGNPTERLDLTAAGLGVLTLQQVLATTQGVNLVDVRSISAFGQLRWKPDPALEVALGARWTDEKRNFTGTKLASPANNFYSPIAVAQPRLKSSKVSPELTLTYTPSDDLTLFGSLKQGYKSGNFIMTTPVPSAGNDNSFGDERARGGEVGFKARVLDRTLTLNGAFYYYDYKGLQVGVNVPAANGVPVIQTINAGSARSYGIEFDLSYRPPEVDGLALHLAGGWNHARFTDFDKAQCWGGQTKAEGCNLRVLADGSVIDVANDPTLAGTAQDLTGARLPKGADWTFNGGFDYDMPMSDDMTLAFGMNGQYSSKFLKNLGTRADFYQPGFFKLNANVALKGPNDAWEVALIANNLTNKFTSGNCTSFSGATGQALLSPTTGGTTRNAAGVDELACIVDPGRQVFLRLTLRPLGL